MIIGYVGNFGPEHSTENHVRTAWTSAGHTVVRVQENDPTAWDTLIDNMASLDMVLWTTTASFAAAIGPKKQVQMLARAKQLGKPTVAFHLDRWHGLDREPALYTLPYFRCDIVITADGGPDWSSIGINHVWMPPAISLPEAEIGEYKQQWASGAVFVGTWRGYHKEWVHRAELIDWLKVNFPKDIRYWPRPGQPAIRGKDLQDLYASVKVVVGDSCLSGGATNYWSDRIPETLGRGGFLVHPNVKGLEEHFEPGKHLMVWEAGDWDTLHKLITKGLNEPEWARAIALAGRDHVRQHHTYERRIEQIIELL
jgi:hypothetical protein